MARNASEEALQRARQRAATSSFFMASALEAYRTHHQLDDAALARFLDCSPQDLLRLAFCRRPASDAVTFRRDVEQIASYASANAERLAQLLREVDALEALSGVRPTAGGMLAAARDRLLLMKPPEDAEPPEGEERKKKRKRRRPREDGERDRPS